ncbi:MAG TPA: hypothetical protein VHE81_12100, partial [Lacipirellulaceae bacterium]|nr:hypothetical protein [Lacipirellulaceae bacterium]
ARQQPRDDQLLSSSMSDRVADPLLWRAVALIALTGVTGFMLGQRFPRENSDRRLPANSLPSAVRDIGRPLTTSPAPGKARYRLSFDATRQMWLLDTDRDNDGNFDFRHQYHASGTAW